MPSNQPQHRNWSASTSGEVGSRQSPVSASEGRRSPNGRRSYQERITTVRFIQPSTGDLMCTKLNRVQRTKAKPDHDAQLCESFLKGHCEAGNGCQFVHVPKQYLWHQLDPQVDPDSYFYFPGFNIRCYTPDMDIYYDIPSEYIYQTRGSDRYVELFNDNGDNFKDKCRLCPSLQAQGKCDKNETCDDIHCAVRDLSQFPHIATHRATAAALTDYERMPGDLVVRVYQPNTPGDGVDFMGSDVLRTAGATQYEEASRQAGGVPSLKMQHCAHFQTKKLCRMGDGCRFLHVVSVALASPAPEDDGTTHTTPSPTAGREMGAEECAMNKAREMAALAMANDGAFIGSPGDNVTLGSSQGNASYPGYGKGPSPTTAIPPPAQQGQQPAPLPLQQQTGSPIYSNSPYVGPVATAATGRMSPVQYRASGRVSPYRVMVATGPTGAAPAQRLSPVSPSSGMMTGSPTQQTQGRISPVRRNNPYALSPSTNTLN
ncbi:hypothetical protein ABB37_04984 [Leptomonas pyrrhocoris]|uniref:C3H1-type domain-containing protein n=1 Tax=Leptomonas pyrrhocoris TaxID=157538 RepID=A0A0N0VF15_LEPPY|nr:hypothetical protein ABB37_04984 [Leptomonas pyrrhocoris]XP_015658371.1 hypothetical protein ABB37_04984 [Leptomonas pyrrhocoris]KPA79931.1 hypothetical protein ABB37_04984 [Leptomonas pyrrhocoris]KPA79932.1 hypothetical protein ABB37_04984 [Leptomonas pyrrhocoris]|eukprot:XP_015658370.1 hypothetical protein ABB37_04984 [Leptomonas pyrrhocoris]